MSEDAQKPYVSLIKIHGKPILGPVITSELRKELLKYKHQAIKLEQRLQNCRKLKKNLDELLEAQNENIRPSSQLTFGDNSHIEALNISDKRKVQNDVKKPKLSRDIIEVTQYDDNGMRTICSNMRLLGCIDNLSENKRCDSDKTDKCISNDAEGAKNTITIDQNINVSNVKDKYQSYDNEFHKPVTPPKPRLIRSNSYTLDSPSPILLAYLQKSCTNGKNGDFNSLASARNWSSLENNHTSFESSDFSSVDTVYHNENCDRSPDKSEAASSPSKSAKNINEVKSPTIEVYQTDISVQQITINTNTTSENGLTREEKSDKFLSKNPFDVFEPDCELLNVLKDIPDTYANQIIELLRTQHLEQKGRLERYDDLNGSPKNICLNPEAFRSQNNSEQNKGNSAQDCFSGESKSNNTSSKITSACDNVIDMAPKSNAHLTNRKESNVNSDRPHTTESCTYSNKTFLTKPTVENKVNYHRPHTTESCANSNKPFLTKSTVGPDRPHTTESSTNSAPCSEKLTRSSTFSMSPSQSLYYSISTDTDTLSASPSPSVKLIDLESDNGEKLEIGVLREKNGYWEGVLIHENAKNLNCSRELFPEFDPVTMNAIKREWAASVIGAHVKGYLTRRLLKTEKVQSLIATIKDVLTCAVELHHSDNIDEKDVELHRRLINQLSAALYSFHDTFFDISTPEQMIIIAADRQRKIEKLKRPPSGRTSARSLSNKSTSSSKSNKSLPSSRSSSKHKLISGSPSLTKV